MACYKGLNARGGTEGVGLATTEAVVLRIYCTFS
ncbi:MAG: ABC transporter permease [Deltaproteobacteria bacterium]|nr:ABC transporter permease [Deltaproteobacteria bacterium]